MILITKRQTQPTVDPIIMTFNIAASGETLTLPLIDTGIESYDFVVNWGDGNQETITTPSASHVYTTSGVKTVTVTGQMEGWHFGGNSQAEKILTMIGGDGQVFKTLSNGGYGAFEGCINLTTLDASNWDISQITDLSWSFYDCSSLETVNVTNWDTSNVTGIFSMFESNTVLTDVIGIGGWDTGNVVDFFGMFTFCESLVTLDIENWDTSNGNDFTTMFNSCYSLTGITLTNWDLSGANDLGDMFEYCGNLVSIGDISSWVTTGVTNMGFMFHDCTSLITEMPAGVFWDNLGGSTSVTTFTSCFTNATNISNYASIPAAWGGGGA